MTSSTYAALNLPSFEVVVREQGQSKQIFDTVRKRFVALTPEEWVRQHFLNYLIVHLSYPAALMAIERQVKVNQLSQRADIVVYDRSGMPWMIIECKAPSVELKNDTFLQVARYYSTLRVPYLVLTNGLGHYCFSMHPDGFDAVAEFPVFPS